MSHPLRGIDPNLVTAPPGSGKHIWVFRPSIEAKDPHTLAIQSSSGAERILVAECEIDGPCRCVYRPDAPIRGGARLWIETYAPVKWRRADGTTGVYG